MIRITVPVIDANFDPSAASFVRHLRAVSSENATFTAAEIYEEYAAFYADGSGRLPPLTRGQLFRRIGVEGLRRFRETTGKRCYRYRLEARTQKPWKIKPQPWTDRGPTVDECRP